MLYLIFWGIRVNSNGVILGHFECTYPYPEKITDAEFVSYLPVEEPPPGMYCRVRHRGWTDMDGLVLLIFLGNMWAESMKQIYNGQA